jgi:acyl-CoA synthetase (AMP-forming)/AMP-acid ligase II
MAASWKHLGLRPDDTVLHCLPMTHSSGFYTLMACIHFGARMVLLERFDADIVLDNVESCYCNWLMGLPFMFAAVMESQRARPRRFASLRLCVTAGDVCPEDSQQEFPRVFGPAALVVGLQREGGDDLQYPIRTRQPVYAGH